MVRRPASRPLREPCQSGTVLVFSSTAQPEKVAINCKRALADTLSGETLIKHCSGLPHPGHVSTAPIFTATDWKRKNISAISLSPPLLVCSEVTPTRAHRHRATLVYLEAGMLPTASNFPWAELDTTIRGSVSAKLNGSRLPPARLPFSPILAAEIAVTASPSPASVTLSAPITRL